MAFTGVSDGEFYKVTFTGPTGLVWSVGSTGVPPALQTYVFNGTDCVIYVIEAASGTFAFIGGQATGFGDSHLNTVSAAFDKDTISTQEGIDFVWAKDLAGATYMFLAQFGTVSSYSVGEAGDLKAFLP